MGVLRSLTLYEPPAYTAGPERVIYLGRPARLSDEVLYIHVRIANQANDIRLDRTQVKALRKYLKTVLDAAEESK
jgi:hypothetical protein